MRSMIFWILNQNLALCFIAPVLGAPCTTKTQGVENLLKKPGIIGAEPTVPKRPGYLGPKITCKELDWSLKIQQAPKTYETFYQ